MYLYAKNFKYFVFFIVYIMLVVLISYFYINSTQEYKKDLAAMNNKIIGMQYLKLLHDISVSTVILEDTELKHQSINKNLEDIALFLEEHSQFKNKELEKLFNFLKKFHIEYSEHDFYNFVDFINTENYKAGNIAEILFSKDRERYFLGTLVTHYLPELLVSLGITHNILEELSSNGSLSKEKKSVYIEHNKLVQLSFEEVSNIIYLLPNAQELSQTLKEFELTLNTLKTHNTSMRILNDNNESISVNTEAMHKLIRISEKLHTQNRILLEELFMQDKISLEKKIIQHNFMVFAILFVITAIFIFTFRILKINEIKDKQLFGQSRLVQMGELISMIAHQWRQPLGAIAATAVSMKFAIELEEYDINTQEGQKKQKQYFMKKLTSIENFVQVLSQTIDDFRNFYKPDKQIVQSNLQEVCEKSLKIIKASLESDGVEIIYEYNSHEDIDMYDSEMMQVLLNIFKNAQDNFKERKI